MSKLTWLGVQLAAAVILISLCSPGWTQTAGGRWRFNEGSGTSAADDLGTANNGTLTNMDVGQAWRTDSPPEGSSYLRFDGVNDFVEVADHSELDFTTNLTLEAFIRANDADVTSQKVIIRKSSATMYRLAITGDHKVKFSIRIAGALKSVTGNSDVIDGSWHHIAGTYDQTNGMRVWVDRVLDAPAVAQTGSVDTDNGALRIGAESASEQQFKGDIDFPQALNEFDTSLPITLTSFTATAGDERVTLRWTTESEIDNSGFEIWRSLQRDTGYVKLPVFITGAGNAASRHDYEYTDRGLTNGTTYYYKLIDVDFGGHRTEHGPVFATPQSERVKGAETKSIPKTYRLEQNYPNPFNPATRIRFDIPLSEKNPGSAITAKVRIFDITGREVVTLVEEPLGPGSYEVVWDGLNRRGERVGSGIYLCVFETQSFSEVRKMTLVR